MVQKHGASLTYTNHYCNIGHKSFLNIHCVNANDSSTTGEFCFEHLLSTSQETF